MGFFDDDPFESIVREFFGGTTAKGKKRETFISGEEEDRTIDFVEDDKKIFLVFEIPGYSEKDISIIVKGRELEISAVKNDVTDIQDYLKTKLQRGFYIKKRLPTIVNTKNFEHTMKNGVLEIIFNKNKGGEYD